MTQDSEELEDSNGQIAIDQEEEGEAEQQEDELEE